MTVTVDKLMERPTRFKDYRKNKQERPPRAIKLKLEEKLRNPEHVKLLELCDCANCPIAQWHRVNPAFTEPNPNARIVLIGEAPGAAEDAGGRPFIGPSGEVVNSCLNEGGLSRSDVYITNTVLCRPSGYNDTPPPEAIRACSGRLQAELSRLPNLEVIVPLGSTAMKALMKTTKSITAMNGVTEKSKEYEGVLVMPTFHPAAGLRGNADYMAATRNVITRAAKLVSGMAIADVEGPKNFTYHHITEYGECAATLVNLLAGDYGFTLALDIETEGFDQINDAILQIAMANDDEAWVFENDLFFDEFLGQGMRDLLLSPRHTWVLHNSNFDLQFLMRDFEFTYPELRDMNITDTLCLAYAVEEQKGSSGLKALSRRFFNAGDYEDEIRKYLPTKATPYSAIPRPILAKYAAQDVIYTARMLPILTDLCEKEGTLQVAQGLMVQAQKTFVGLEFDGINLDLGEVSSLRKQWLPLIEEMKGQLQAIAARPEYGFDARNVSKSAKGPELNPNASGQLAHLFYDCLRLPVPEANYQAKIRAAAKGLDARPTGKEFREAYLGYDGVAGELAEILTRYALARKMMTTYIEGIADDIRTERGNPDSPRHIHPSFNISGTTTGRLTITDPPLQTIPRATTTQDFSSIKRMFVPSRPEEMVILEADHSQLELRIGWLLSGDPAMGADILDGDFHRNTAARIFSKPRELVTSSERHNTKYVTFGIMYGRGGYSLSMGELKGTGYDGDTFVREWFNAYHVYRDWWKENRENAIRNGKLVSKTGRVRRWQIIFQEQMLKGVLSGNPSKEARDLMNQAANFPIQSFASDLTLMALILLDRRFRELGWGRGLFTVHDANITEVRKEVVNDAALMMKVVMEDPRTLTKFFGFDIPMFPEFVLEANPSVGPTWGDTKDVEILDNSIGSRADFIHKIAFAG